MKHKAAAGTICGIIPVLLLNVPNDVNVRKSPGIPSFVPGGIEISGMVVRLQDVFYVPLSKDELNWFWNFE